MSKTSSKNKYENLLQWLKIRKNHTKPKITIYSK